MGEFYQWRELVNSIVFILTNNFIDDLPDENYRINFDNGLHACDMAKIVEANFMQSFM
jgi:hypothetical protein